MMMMMMRWLARAVGIAVVGRSDATVKRGLTPPFSTQQGASILILILIIVLITTTTSRMTQLLNDKLNRLFGLLGDHALI